MEVLYKLLAALFPSRCILCRQTVHRPAINHAVEICPRCYQKLPFNDCSCPVCALPLPKAGGVRTLCGRCLKKLPLYDYCYSLFRYEGEVIQLVHQLKFRDKISYARSIGELLCNCLQAEIERAADRPDCLLPVPLHNTRLRQRGYNQSIEIARVIARKLAIPIEFDLVQRQRHTQAQSGLNASQRRKNIRNAFRVSSAVNYEHILIIDDVVTTGATINELARLLKRHGVARVGVLSFARAPVRK
jgi:ComF family protein